MDKYLLVVLIFLIGGVAIALTRTPFIPGLFYAMIAGIIIVVVYSGIKSKRVQRELRREKRKKGKFKK